MGDTEYFDFQQIDPCVRKSSGCSNGCWACFGIDNFIDIIIESVDPICRNSADMQYMIEKIPKR